MTQRDTFISNLFEKAKQDKDIIMISVDMGAPTLDVWRETLPDQFIAAGISEQNAINVAAGLSIQHLGTVSVSKSDLNNAIRKL